MAGIERERAALLRVAAQSWGEEAAVTLAELLPPAGDRPATGRDLARLDDRFDRFERRMDDRFAAQTAHLDERLDERLEAMTDRMTAVFERRISDAVSMQTRTLVFSQLGALVVISALAFGLA